MADNHGKRRSAEAQPQPVEVQIGKTRAFVSWTPMTAEQETIFIRELALLIAWVQQEQREQQ